MNTRSTLPRYTRMSIMVILGAVLAVSFNPAAASINPLPAIDATEEGTSRADMLAIADRYVNYTWIAINSEWGMS